MPDNKKRSEEALANLNRELKSRERKTKTRPVGVALIALLAIVALVGGVWFMASRDSSDEEITAEDQNTTETTESEEQPEAVALTGKRAETLPETVTCEYPATEGQDSNGATVPNGDDVSTKGTVKVNFATNQGDMEMELDRSVAPCTVNAITHLADEGYYDGSICHRMTSGGLNVLQCGDPTGTGSGGPGFSFANEYPTEKDAEAGQPVTYPKGSIAMANSGKDTNGSQFFVNYADSQLAPDYTYFGKLTEKGQETLDKIAEKGVEGGQPNGKPAEEVKIDKVSVES